MEKSFILAESCLILGAALIQSILIENVGLPDI